MHSLQKYLSFYCCISLCFLLDNNRMSMSRVIPLLKYKAFQQLFETPITFETLLKPSWHLSLFNLLLEHLQKVNFKKCFQKNWLNIGPTPLFLCVYRLEQQTLWIHSCNLWHCTLCLWFLNLKLYSHLEEQFQDGSLHILLKPSIVLCTGALEQCLSGY